MPEPHDPADGPPSPHTDGSILARTFAHDDLRVLRQEVTRCARANGLTDPVLYRFVLAVHELATNAVRHGGGRGRLELHRAGDRLRCRVSDQGAGMPAAHRPVRPAPDAPSGRGIWLAQHGGDLSWASHDHGTDFTLTCRLSSQPPRS